MLFDTILKYREYKIFRNASAQFISTYIIKIGNSKKKIQFLKKINREFIFMYIVEMNN